MTLLLHRVLFHAVAMAAVSLHGGLLHRLFLDHLAFGGCLRIGVTLRESGTGESDPGNAGGGENSGNGYRFVSYWDVGEHR